MAEESRAAARRWRQLLADERNAAALYERLARTQTGERREIFEDLSRVELRHAQHWADKLTAAGLPVPPRNRITLRTRTLGVAARFFPNSALSVIERAERADAGVYDADRDATTRMAQEERGHAATLAALRTGKAGGLHGTGGAPVQQAETAGLQPIQEPWHRSSNSSGALRAGVFGVSDGLVSNTALVMGIAGSGASAKSILVAGIAGWLAGAFSMAAGEYVSMASQREMFQREIALEAEELREHPQEEREELVLIYRAKGLSREEAEQVADRVMADPQVALDTLAREELGLDPDDLGSPWTAAISSMVAFSIGALVVVLPWLFASGTTAVAGTVVLAVVALVAVGAGTGVLNGRSPVHGALRQLLAGTLAAGVTYGIGALLGTSLG